MICLPTLSSRAHPNNSRTFKTRARGGLVCKAPGRPGALHRYAVWRTRWHVPRDNPDWKRVFCQGVPRRVHPIGPGHARFVAVVAARVCGCGAGFRRRHDGHRGVAECEAAVCPRGALVPDQLEPKSCWITPRRGSFAALRANPSTSTQLHACSRSTANRGRAALIAERLAPTRSKRSEDASLRGTLMFSFRGRNRADVLAKHIYFSVLGKN